MTPAISAICRATSAALPTSVWTRMYACTMTSSWEKRTIATLKLSRYSNGPDLFHPGRMFFWLIGVFCDTHAPARTPTPRNTSPAHRDHDHADPGPGP